MNQTNSKEKLDTIKLRLFWLKVRMRRVKWYFHFTRNNPCHTARFYHEFKQIIGQDNWGRLQPEIRRAWDAAAGSFDKMYGLIKGWTAGQYNGPTKCWKAWLIKRWAERRDIEPKKCWFIERWTKIIAWLVKYWRAKQFNELFVGESYGELKEKYDALWDSCKAAFKKAEESYNVLDNNAEMWKGLEEKQRFFWSMIEDERIDINTRQSILQKLYTEVEEYIKSIDHISGLKDAIDKEKKFLKPIVDEEWVESPLKEVKELIEKLNSKLRNNTPDMQELSKGIEEIKKAIGELEGTLPKTVETKRNTDT